MSADKTRASVLADEAPIADTDRTHRWIQDATAELRRLSASNDELIEALTMAAQIIGHPEDAMSQHLADVLGRAKEARNA